MPSHRSHSSSHDDKPYETTIERTSGSRRSGSHRTSSSSSRHTSSSRHHDADIGALVPLMRSSSLTNQHSSSCRTRSVSRSKDSHREKGDVYVVSFSKKDKEKSKSRSRADSSGSKGSRRELVPYIPSSSSSSSRARRSRAYTTGGGAGVALMLPTVYEEGGNYADYGRYAGSAYPAGGTVAVREREYGGRSSGGRSGREVGRSRASSGACSCGGGGGGRRSIEIVMSSESCCSCGEGTVKQSFGIRIDESGVGIEGGDGYGSGRSHRYY